MPFYPLGGVTGNIKWRIVIVVPDYCPISVLLLLLLILLVFNSNFRSILHRFRAIRDVCSKKNYVVPISALSGATYNI